MEVTRHDEATVGLEKTMVTVRCCCDWVWDKKWCPRSYGRRRLLNRTGSDGTAVGLERALVTDRCCCGNGTRISWDKMEEEWTHAVTLGHMVI
jgi:hypothetical protein